MFAHDLCPSQVECKGVADKLKRLREGQIDIAIGGITITEQREESLFFCPYSAILLPSCPRI